MPVNWDDAKERQFLLSIIHAQGAVASPNWSTVATLMGPDYTANGLRQKFDKMKKLAKGQFGEMHTVEGEAAPNTPKRGAKKAGGEGTTKSTGKRKSKSVAKVAAQDEEEADAEAKAEESPSKKVKTEAVPEDELY